jgi:hypothetical protein
MAALKNSAMRDAALGVAVGRYLSVLPRPNRSGGGRLSERILSGLTFRREPELYRTLVSLPVAMAPRVRDELDHQVNRVLAATDMTDLDAWQGDLAIDLRSSVIEAIAVEWMHQRSLAFDVALGRDCSLGPRPTRVRRVRGTRAH